MVGYASFPGVDNQKLLKAVDKALVMGAAMDGKALKDAVMAHHDAVSAAGGKAGVTTLAAYTNVLSTLGKAISTVPEDKVLDVFNAYKELINTPGEFPAAFSYLMSTGNINPADAYAAAGGFLDLADAVKKAR